MCVEWELSLWLSIDGHVSVHLLISLRLRKLLRKEFR
ncbi:hypothetical protein EVA_06260 [gut metagenome]|uniref:Uncharacterized protein n=1 Tax=gut metagenome TaxID=749906 RepID=J9GE74_9ZZZZ